MLEPEELRRHERTLAAIIREAGRQDPEGYAQLLRILRTAETDMAHAWTRTGYSFTDLGRVLGITRANARKWVTRRLGVSSLTAKLDG